MRSATPVPPGQTRAAGGDPTRPFRIRDDVGMKKSFGLRLVLVLVAINTAIALFVLLGGQMNETGGKVLGSSLLATMGAVIALTCAPALAAKRAGYFPHLGMLGAAVSSGLFIIALWMEAGGDTYFRIAGTAVVVAITASLASILSAWRGAGAMKWVQPATTLFAAVGGGMIVAAIWGDVGGGEYWRIFGIIMVLLAAGALATPVVHRMSNAEHPQAFGHCPFCGATVEGMAGRVFTCPSCSRRYEVSPR